MVLYNLSKVLIGTRNYHSLCSVFGTKRELKDDIENIPIFKETSCQTKTNNKEVEVIVRLKKGITETFRRFTTVGTKRCTVQVFKLESKQKERE